MWVIGAGKSRRGRLVNWVEKARVEKICRLLEVSEQERHYEVLLTLKDITDMRQNPAPYSLPIIPRPLPSEIVNWEHFVTADLLHLISDSASSSRDSKAVISGWELVARTPSVLSASTSGGSGFSKPAPSRIGATGVTILSAFP